MNENQLNSHYDQFETSYLLSRLGLDPAKEVRASIEHVLLQRGLPLAEIQAAFHTDKSIPAESVSLIDKKKGSILSHAAKAGALIAAGFILHGLLRENGSSSAIRLFQIGDNDAATLKLFATSSFFAAGSLLLAFINRGVSFYSTLGALLTLLFSTAYYGFIASLIPSSAYVAILFFEHRSKWHKVVVQDWLAIVISVPIYGLILVLLIAPFVR